jgi:uncharacterized protein (UPF0212 family)
MHRVALVALSLVGSASVAFGGDPRPAQPVVTVPTFANATCPIMAKPASKALFVDTDKGRIYICCMPCAAKIKADVARAHAAAYPTVKKAGNKVCPVTGKPVVEGLAVTLQGYEVGLCSAGCAKVAQANAQTTLVKAIDPAVVDVGNMTCPITGEPVAANAFCLVDKNLVRLSSPKRVADVQRDPAGVLAKAKQIAEAQRSSRPTR